MGFSIGRLLGGLAPIVGGIFGGPVGAAIGGAIGAGFVGLNGADSSQVGPTAAQLPRLPIPRFPLPKFPQIPGDISGTVIGAVSLVAALLAKSRQVTGRPVSVQKVKDAVKHCGIALAATMFGLTESEICTIVISKRRRRGRGISAADLRRTRSTIRKVHNISHDLRALVPRVRAHHR